MFSTLRTRFGIPGVISVIALVFAMFSGAYAASNSSGGGKATASAKGKQGPRGKTGKTGPAGPAGPQGPAGAAGAKGDAGAAGANGTNGTNGTNGISPTGASFTGSKTVGSVTCTEGGTEYKGATTNLVCNGKAGEQGEEGEPGILHPEETLPSEATEAGTFSVKGENKQFQTVPFGWPIPLTPAAAAAITEEKIHVVGPAGAGTCNGTAKDPTAPAGELCLYKAVGEGGIFTGQEIFINQMGPLNPGASTFPDPGVSTAGALIYSNEFEWSTSSWVQGTFAITAP
jgi:hypothetical protein